MEPVSTAMVAALGMLSEKVVLDAYGGLKSLLVKKFGNESELVATAVAELPETEILVSDDLARQAESTSDSTISEISTGIVTRRNSPAVVALALDEKTSQHHDMAAHYKLKCPECGSGLAMQEGCCKCRDCGWAAC